MSLFSLILTLSIISGQLIKIPLFGSSGITILDIVTAFLCLVGIFSLKLRLKKPPLFIKGAIVFIFIATLSLIFTPLHMQLSEYITSFLYTVRFAAFIFLGWIMFSGAFPKFRSQIPQILIFSGLGLAILGLLQFIFLPDLRFLAAYGWDPHYYRTASTFLDPNFAGAFFALTLLLILSYLRNGRLLPPKVLYILFTIAYFALLTTFSRSSYLMFLVSGLTFSFLKKSIKTACLTIILFLVLLLSFQIYIRAVNRITPLDRNQTASYRLSTWQQGFQLFQKSPLLGIGFNSYNFALKQFNLGDNQFLAGKGSTTNDSSLLYILSTTGILGLLSYFLFIGGMIKTKNATLIAGILGLFFHSFFVNSLFYPFILIWIILSSVEEYAK